MRLMQADESGASALECLYCGARSESRPPYAVMYCDCRYPRQDGDAAPRNTLPLAARAAA
jgi:hypothetical protein